MKAIIKRLKSRTYWLGIATLLLGALEHAQATGLIPQMVGEEQRIYVLFAVAMAIFLLRELTTGKVGDK